VHAFTQLALPAVALSKGVQPDQEENPGVPTSMLCAADWRKATRVEEEVSGEKKGVTARGAAAAAAAAAVALAARTVAVAGRRTNPEDVN
jgi:hypothetical protein